MVVQDVALPTFGLEAGSFFSAHPPVLVDVPVPGVLVPNVSLWPRGNSMAASFTQ